MRAIKFARLANAPKSPRAPTSNSSPTCSGAHSSPAGHGRRPRAAFADAVVDTVLAGLRFAAPPRKRPLPRQSRCSSRKRQHREPVGLKYGVLDAVIALGPRAVVMIAVDLDVHSGQRKMENLKPRWCVLTTG